MRRLKQLEDENAKLKKLVAGLSLDKEMPQDVLRRKAVKEKVKDWRGYYNEERPHGSIGNRPAILLQRRDGATSPSSWLES
jgi:transposase InsO family protein